MHMAGNTGHHAMGMMIKLSMPQPTCGDIRFRYLRQSASGRSKNMALPAGLGPQQPFGVLDSELHPLDGIAGHRSKPNPFW